MSIIDYSIFRERLNALISRKSRGRVQVSEDTGIATPTLSRYINGERTPDLEYVFRLAQYFRVSMDYLIGLDTNEASSISPENKELLKAYEMASADDKEVVDVILRKYKERLDAPDFSDSDK